jgi:hypothetical protein
METKLQQLTVDERIKLVEDLWDSIAADQGALPISADQRIELDRSGSPLSTVRIRWISHPATRQPGLGSSRLGPRTNTTAQLGGGDILVGNCHVSRLVETCRSG